MEKNSTIQSMLTHLAYEAALPSEINLWPAIRVRLDARKTFSQAEGHKMTTNTEKSKLFRLIKIGTLILILVLGTVLTLPQGRAWAQTIMRFFTPERSSTFLLPAQDAAPEMIATPTFAMPALAGCDDALASLNVRCAVGGAEAALGFTVQVFPSDPEGFTFTRAYTDLNQNLISLTYVRDGGELTLTQIHGTSITSPWEASWGSVPPDSIEKVQINGFDGEYVRGMFVVNSQTGTEAAWESDAPVQRLRWREGDVLFEIILNGLPGYDELIGKNWLITLAENLR